jgi:peptide/nickel transport system permease protein
MQKTKDILLKYMKIILAFIVRTLRKNKYLFARLGVAVITLFLTATLSFLLILNMPGDVIDSYTIELANQRRITMEEARRLAVQILNYDPEASFFSKYYTYFQGLLSGDLGSSMFIDGLTAIDVISASLPWTLFISTVSLVISFIIGTAIGTKMSYKRSPKVEIASSSYIVISSSVPDYLIGLLLLYIFSFTLGWFPSQGNYDIMFDAGFNIPFLLDVLYHGFLMILAYVIVQVGTWALMMKGSSISTLGEDYIYAARVRGIPEKIIMKKYLKKNSILPLITSLAISFALLFGGSPLMESIFNYPGIGQQLSIAIGRRDYFIVQGLFVFISAVVIFVNLIADTLYSVLDPRVRRGA